MEQAAFSFVLVPRTLLLPQHNHVVVSDLKGRISCFDNEN